MKERPILFNADMVRAILDGRKTQTRRLVKERRGPSLSTCEPEVILKYPNMKYSAIAQSHPRWGFCVFGATEKECAHELRHFSPFGKPGDRLWVRETFAARVNHACGQDACDCGDVTVTYTADNEERFFNDDSSMGDFCINGRKTIPSIHMPRWASRITLEIKSVNVSRLHDVTEEDARACGFKSKTYESGFVGDAKWHYRQFWEQSMKDENKPDWYANPWVWVIEFERVKP